jgi:hypothetical protein
MKWYGASVNDRSLAMTLSDVLQDIYALGDEMRAYERKYGVLSETFYEAYLSGEESLHAAPAVRIYPLFHADRSAAWPTVRRADR